MAKNAAYAIGGAGGAELASCIRSKQGRPGAARPPRRARAPRPPGWRRCVAGGVEAPRQAPEGGVRSAGGGCRVCTLRAVRGARRQSGRWKLSNEGRPAPGPRGSSQAGPRRLVRRRAWAAANVRRPGAPPREARAADGDKARGWRGQSWPRAPQPAAAAGAAGRPCPWARPPPRAQQAAGAAAGPAVRPRAPGPALHPARARAPRRRWAAPRWWGRTRATAGTAPGAPRDRRRQAGAAMSRGRGHGRGRPWGGQCGGSRCGRCRQTHCRRSRCPRSRGYRCRCPGGVGAGREGEVGVSARRSRGRARLAGRHAAAPRAASNQCKTGPSAHLGVAAGAASRPRVAAAAAAAAVAVQQRVVGRHARLPLLVAARVAAAVLARAGVA
jgi:hypothetical protein